MSYFIAVVPQGLPENNEVKRLFSKFKRTVNDKDKEVRWVAPALWHLTVVFIGLKTDEEIIGLKDYFEKWPVPENALDLELRVQGVGAFSEVSHARVLWLGIQKNQALLDLQSNLTEDFKSFALKPDEREFNPHITLARFRNSMDVTDLVKLGGRKHFGDYKIKELILFESVIQGNMAKYIPISRRMLVRE